ncbi:MAG TPA: glycerophosphodiester phosphodiesterase family protein, partial [Gemmataceae bacterium]|nr:glycerophosphodiester phosphodiesterase family protein [Gemmataceae bacterium]
FVVAACVFDNATGLGSLRSSAEITRGHRGRILVWIAAWQFLRFVVSAIVLLGIGRLNLAVIGTDTDGGDAIVRAIVCLGLDAIILLLLSILDSVGFGLMVAVQFENLHLRGRTIAAEAHGGSSTFRPAARSLQFAAWAGLILLGGSVLGQAALLAVRYAARPVTVTAHRTGALNAPENTLAALRQAIADGADAAEIDVQETADGVVVVLHDKDLRRMTGDPRNIWDVTRDDLRSLDCGRLFGPKFAGERIATLEEFLEASAGRIKLNIELKYNGHDERLVQRVVDLLRKHDFLSQAVITSLEYRGLQEVRRLEPRMRTGYVIAAKLGDLTGLDVDFLSIRDGLVTPSLRRMAWHRDWELHVWTLNARPQLEAMLDLDADDLITDNVVLAREVLRERESLPERELIMRRLQAWLRSGR